MPEVVIYAIEIPQIIKDIGSYAGFAAVIGLGVLSALYFSQARDVKRLREWAGRAPERAAEEEERVQAAARAAAVAGGSKPAVAAQQGSATAAQTAAARTAAGAAGAGAGAGAAAGSKPGGGVATAPRFPATRAAQQAQAQNTAVLGKGAPADKDPWYRFYRRIDWPEPRYIALIVAGVLIVGGGAAFGVTKLLEDDAPRQQAGGGGGGSEESTRVVPEEVKVSVLNGTAVNGLAAQIGDKLKRKGYQVVNQANASDQARAESVVLWVGDAKDEARSVARSLDISQKEKADEASIDLAGDAIVIVVVGADQTDPAAPPEEPAAPPTQTVPAQPGTPGATTP